MIFTSNALRGDAGAAEPIRRITTGDQPAFADSVAVTGSELVHTTQLLPVDQHGVLIGDDDPERQVQRVLDQVLDVLAAQGVQPDDLVKLNIYVENENAGNEFFRTLRARCRHALPAISFVTTRLPVEGALIAVDAIGARPLTIVDSLPTLRREPTVAGSERMAHSAVLPIGETIYISGQAEPGDNLTDATTNTLAGLKRTLDHLGLGLEHVVQLKCFLQPMAGVRQTHAAIETFFGDRIAPPVSVVEWISSLPIEIEMIVHSPQDTPGTGVTHEWLPWLNNSPVYCRLARVHSAEQIFISSCVGELRSDDARQVPQAFEMLRKRLAAAGSDLFHMAKATYYVRNEVASAAVNEIRPTLYDPEHPPAASKALVYGVGQNGRSVALDMIAVPGAE